ncbi:reverse transcriptase-like protein [Elysia marginata]|uniref:Reverse transcriptase-like protein n=1 Tax=Elysia marginata TaxID=1093978 RepID=A0AAV4GX79_9GAST|nr:reverse transcriptase-like protein [Elysia marginata]
MLKRLSISFGLSGTVLKWFTSYLRDRQYFVIVKGNRSVHTPLKFGVPQGHNSDDVGRNDDEGGNDTDDDGGNVTDDDDGGDDSGPPLGSISEPGLQERAALQVQGLRTAEVCGLPRPTYDQSLETTHTRVSIRIQPI